MLGDSPIAFFGDGPLSNKDDPSLLDFANDIDAAGKGALTSCHESAFRFEVAPIRTPSHHERYCASLNPPVQHCLPYGAGCYSSHCQVFPDRASPYLHSFSSRWNDVGPSFIEERLSEG